MSMMFHFQCLHSDHVNSMVLLVWIGTDWKTERKKSTHTYTHTINEFEIHGITMKTIAMNWKLNGIVYCMQFALLYALTIYASATMGEVYTLPYFLLFNIKIRRIWIQMLDETLAQSFTFGYPPVHSNCFISHEHWTQFQQNINANNVYCAGRFYRYIPIYNSNKPKIREKISFVPLKLLLFIHSFIYSFIKCKIPNFDRTS